MTQDAHDARDALLRVSKLNVAYGAQRAVVDLDFDLKAGETLALVGESGCGKSTTAMSLLRLLPRHATASGRVQFEGVDLLAMDEPRLSAVRGRRIAMIFQEPMTSLNPVLTIGAQVGEALQVHLGLSARAARRRAIELLDLVRVPEPERRVDDYAHQLSGGQRQRAMIAAAIACEPALLIADEPTTALDVTVQAEILQLLDSLRRDLGMGLLLITHDLGVVADWADRVVVMYGGRAVEQQHTAGLFAAPRHAYSRGLLGAALHVDTDRHYLEARLPEIRADRTAAGELEFTLETPPMPVLPALPRGTDRPGASVAAPLLAVEQLNTSYDTPQGRRHVVRDVSFSVAKGETVGLVGESGCGKSTLSRTIMRLVDPSSGRIVLDGVDIARLSRRALTPYRRRLQMVFQDPYSSLNPRQTVEQILQFALSVQGVLPAAERGRRIASIVDAVGLPLSALNRYPYQFSGGQRQRIGIARALVLKPAMLICDEPVSALDVSIQAQILNLLVDLKAEFGLSLLFISHDLSVVRYIADRVLVMNAGTIVESGAPDALWSAPTHPYTRSLIASMPGRRRIELGNAAYA
ncbi:ABC transporter ATP-binding protein [Paraburkholderia sp.]|uniref:ABC transporter ATP-binding protein n=1 Tax=Paraburkholderia sp. TaxID=1926495 RepID=UPI002398F61B|nr:ABC transporter ATP-binding protein [Paraburkholderia sp.]MDE1180867.1 ABC transporter ATP-binding protein [Paraburkholderia sp.]